MIRARDFLLIPKIDVWKRNFGLDLARALAISLVVLNHGIYFVPKGFNKYKVFEGSGFFGVELFFVLSGFLIGRILLKAFDPRSKSIGPLFKFWNRRWWRTLPNYYLFLLLNITVVAWLFPTRHSFDIRYIFFLQNFETVCPTLMPESWSLAVEEWFYLLFPIVLFLFVRWHGDQRKGFFWATVSFIVFFFVVRCSRAPYIQTSWDAGVRKVVILRLDAIAYGALLTYAVFYHEDAVRKFSKFMFVMGCLTLAVMASIYSVNIFKTKNIFLFRTLFFTLTNTALALLLPKLIEWKMKRGTIHYMVSHISIVSYSMYLLNLPIAKILVKFCFSRTHSPWYVEFPLFVTITIFLSTIVYKFFEMPLTSMREHFFNQDTRNVVVP